MAADEPSLSLEADPMLASRRPPAPLSELRENVFPLGEALKLRAAEVRELTLARVRGGEDLDAVVQERFLQINHSSTIALAGWIAGEGLEGAIEAGKETWII